MTRTCQEDERAPRRTHCPPAEWLRDNGRIHKAHGEKKRKGKKKAHTGHKTCFVICDEVIKTTDIQSAKCSPIRHNHSLIEERTKKP